MKEIFENIVRSIIRRIILFISPQFFSPQTWLIDYFAIHVKKARIFHHFSVFRGFDPNGSTFFRDF